MRKITLSLASLLFASTCAAQQAAVALEGRYEDVLHGFSLQPPAGTERKRDFSPSRLVSWQRRDPQTGAIVWTLSVLRMIERNGVTDMKAYSQALAAKLTAEEGFQIEQMQLHPVAGKAAMDFRGTTGGNLQLWKRQVWVLAQSQQFLVFVISGSPYASDEMDSVCDAVLKTLTLSDPKAAMELRKKYLQAGQDVLSRLDDAKLSAALQTAPQWFLVRDKGKDIGYMKVVEKAATCDGASGFETRIWGLLQPPGQQPVLRKRYSFTTADRSSERWTDHVQLGSGASAVRQMEDGLKQQELIANNIICEGAPPKTAQKQAPQAIYLPRALDMILPRLLDLSRAGVYAFAVYNGQANDFDMRTFSVQGRRIVELRGKRQEVIVASDQQAADKEPLTVYLDPAAGTLLLTQSQDGSMSIQAADEQAVLLRFPTALNVIQALGD